MKTVGSKRRGKDQKSTGKESLAWRCYLYNKWLIICTTKLKVCLQNIRCLAHKHNMAGNTTSRSFNRNNEAVPLKVSFHKENCANFMNSALGSTFPSRSVNPLLETCHTGKRVNIVQEIAVYNLDPLLSSVYQPCNNQDSEDMELVQSLHASKKFCPFLHSPVASTQPEENCSPYKFLGIHTSPWNTHTPLLFSPSVLSVKKKANLGNSTVIQNSNKVI
ncbi:uncharacterized protein [Macrobrachium rosenbergii]|uniref:uncharacterized protein isoform X2 n=1 Tax=Macrobrachium rosenbergii TaxID=79674 RepID=UPI0034D637E7